VLLNSTKVEGLSLTEQDAFSMSQAAILLDQARAKGDMKALAAALDHNLELWVGIRTLVSRPEVRVSQNVQENLTKLANYVADATMSHGVEIPEKTLDTLININLQVSEGLLEGKLNLERSMARQKTQ
jgi:flagellar biosynthesis regulator FlaF